MRPEKLGLGAGSVLLFIAAWAVGTYVDKSSPFAVVLLGAAVIAALVWLASTQLAGRVFWARIASMLEPHLSTGSASQISEDKRQARVAGNRILAELRDVGLRLEDWIGEGVGWWQDTYSLPDFEWTQLRDQVAGDPDLSEAWDMVSHAYARIDAVNRAQSRLTKAEEAYQYVGGVIEDEPNIDPGIADLEEARKAVGRAERELSKALGRLSG